MIGIQGDRPGPGRQDQADRLGVPAGQKDDYRQLAQTAAILGKGVVDLAAAAKLLGAPDPAALGAAGADWDNFSNSGVVLQAWARLVLDNLPAQPAALHRRGLRRSSRVDVVARPVETADGNGALRPSRRVRAPPAPDVPG